MVIAAILPLFLLIALGWLAGRTGYLPVGHGDALGDLVFRLALPALIFLAVAAGPPGQTIDPALLLGYGGGSLAAFAIVLAGARFAAGRPTNQAAILALGSSTSMSGYIGYAVAHVLIGPMASNVLAHCVIVENFVMLPLAYLLSAPGAGWGPARPAVFLRDLARQLATNPLLVAVAAGLAASRLGIVLPPPAETAMKLLSQITGPTALIVVGLSLASLRVETRALADAASIAGLKLLLHPLAVFLLLSVLPGLPPVAVFGGTLFAAVPMVSIYPIFGQRVGLAAFTALALLLAVAASPLTIGLLARFAVAP